MGRKTLTHDDFIKRVDDLNPNILIIGKYTKSTDKIKCKCKKCGYIWDKTASNIINGSGCPSCSNLKRMTHNEFEDKLYKLKPNIKLLGEFKNTRTKIQVKCINCKYTWDVVANTLLNTQCGCPNCSGNGEVTIDDFIESLKKHNLKLIESVDSFTSKTNMLVKCNICKSEFKTTYNRSTIQGSGCAVCKNKKVLKGFNDLWTTHTEIAKLLLNSEDGHKYTFASQKKVKWKCPNCNNIMTKSVGEVYKNGLTCANCSDGISYPEKFIRNLLLLNDIDFICQKSFEWSDKRRYDFYLPKQHTIIETHGEQHYIEKQFFANRTLDEEQQNDKYKEDLAKQNNVTHYFVLNCRYSNCKWIKESVVKSEFLTLCNLNESNIDWNLIDLKSRDSLVYEVCTMYKDGFSKSTILYKLKISESTYYRYLNIGTKSNLCNYKSRISAS